MVTDMNVSRFDATKVLYAKNIRITQVEGNQGLLCVTNEKGPNACTVSSAIAGIILGNAVINERLILFTHNHGASSPDHIYRLAEGTSYNFDVTELFSGNLGFASDHPIETVAVYETEDIQKVYWVDGLNQLRCINVCNDTNTGTMESVDGTQTLFDACPTMDLVHRIIVEKLESGGEFPAGTIQYAFTYFNTNGPETNVFGVTALYELCPKTKGLAADGRAVCSFRLTLSLLEPNFEYVRVYAIVRTSANATPSVRIVGDYAITVAPGSSSGNTITVVDNGAIGESVDASYLLFAGGEPVCPATITVKDNTLFLGNISLKRPSLANIGYNGSTVGDAISALREAGKIPLVNAGSSNSTVGSGDWFYDYKINNNRPSTNLRRFKRGEIYRLGIIAQYETGIWSDVLWLGDYENTVTPEFYKNHQKAGYFKLYNQLTGQSDTNIVDILTAIQEAGFKNIAPVVVYPEGTDRTVFCQGLVSATVYNVEDRYNNKPFSQASWFFRPIAEGFGFAAIPHASLYPVTLNTYDIPGNDSGRRPGAPDTFNDDIVGNAEIQINTNPRNFLPRVKGYWGATQLNPEWLELTADEMLGLFGNDYYVDTSIVTLNSPEIEFDDSLEQEDLKDLKFRIVGMAKSGYQNVVADAYLDVSSGRTTSERVLSPALSRYLIAVVRPQTYRIANIPSYPGYTGIVQMTDGTSTVNYIRSYIIHPWHKSGRIVGNSDDTYDKEFNVLNSKIYSNLWFAHTQLFDTIDEVDVDTEQIKLFDDTQSSFIPLGETADGPVYYGNVDSVRLYKKDILGVHSPNLNNNFNMQEPVVKGDENPACKFNEKVRTPVTTNEYAVAAGVFLGTAGSADATNDISVELALRRAGGRRYLPAGNDYLDKSPVPIRYKSTKHIVIPLSHDATEIPSLYRCEGLCELDSTYDVSTHNLTVNPFWDYETTYTYTPGKVPFATEISNVDYNRTWTGDEKTGYKNTQSLIPTLYIGELYREFSQDQLDARFGGKTVEALQKNIWTRCGDAIGLTDIIVGGLQPPPSSSHYVVKTLNFYEGDTYLTRYDCLKTYPYADKDVNSIVEIFSTDLETRVNLDARYDNARGLLDNTLVRPENINLVNRLGFEQENNFFTYSTINPAREGGNSFPNLLAITREKTLGEEIDSWCSVDLLSTQDLEGTYGKITALKTYNNDVYAFQDNAFGQVLFNSRVQIPTSDGQPIEITNGFKLQGIRYLSNKIGCSNKWSIALSNSKMYWFDDGTADIWSFSSQGLDNISTRLGVKGWFNNAAKGSWSPADKAHIRTVHDEKYNDLYFVNTLSSPSDYHGALVYSESLDSFISVMDYDAVGDMITFKDNTYILRGGSIHKMWAGSYNSFFGTSKPYFIRFIANAQPTMHKVFDTLQWRSDTWNTSGKYLPNETFKTVKVWNQYQMSRLTSLTNTPGKPSPLKKKFNTFRALVPRDSCVAADIQTDSDYRRRTFGRIRGNYAVVELTHNGGDTNKMQFYDLEIGEFL